MILSFWLVRRLRSRMEFDISTMTRLRASQRAAAVAVMESANALHLRGFNLEAQKLGR